MKRISMAIIAVFAFGVIANAQFSFGPKIGLGISNVKFTFPSDAPTYLTDAPTYLKVYTQSSFGGSFGVAVNYELSDALSIQSGLMYAMKGYQFDVEKTYSDATEEATGTNKVSLNYLEMPINVAYSLPIGDNKLSFYAGPNIGFFLGGKDKEDFTTKVIATGEETKHRDEITIKANNEPTLAEINKDKENQWKSMDLGLNIGASFQINKLVLGIGTTLGLSNDQPKYEKAVKENDPNTTYKDSDYKAKMWSVGVSVAYMFGVK